MPLYRIPTHVKVTADDEEAQFLQDKLIEGDSISITKEATSGVETLRIAAVVSEVFSTDYDEAFNVIATSSTIAQNAGISVTAPVDGDYVVLYGTEIRATNNFALAAISLSNPNTTTELTGSIRRTGGNKVLTTFTLQTYVGLSQGDVITALYRKFVGGGSVRLGRRSIFLQRSG